MTIDQDTALVLEGGGLRGVFTVGVSAGTCNGLSYMSGQRGRAKASNIDLMEKHHYIGFKYLLTQKCIMDFKLLFDFSNPDRFVMVTTNCQTGKAEYFEEKSSSARVMDIVDSIPVEYALSQGYNRKYPELQKAIRTRNAEYNRTMDLIERLEEEGYEIAKEFLSSASDKD